MAAKLIGTQPYLARLEFSFVLAYGNANLISDFDPPPRKSAPGRIRIMTAYVNDAKGLVWNRGRSISRIPWTSFRFIFTIRVASAPLGYQSTGRLRTLIAASASSVKKPG
ncbi:hypothetical protein AGR1B_Lc50440 [Agrobacterium fabacearum S56]|nr:hypothetical protein AGR1B_Lc50440 [Agrobacterium fabacearum S56]